MDNQDQKKTSPSGHENHGVHICHRCGWPFPNSHPSAKHRRAHKRVCGTVEGYKLSDLEAHTQLAVSDHEHPSDEDRQTPSPKIEKRSIKEIGSGGIGERSSRSEDEVFSDAVTEFSESGFSPGMEERFVGNRDLDKKNVDESVEGDLESSQSLKIPVTAGITELQNTPIDSKVDKLEVFESPDTKLVQDTQTKKNEEDEADKVLAKVAEPPNNTVCESSEAEIKSQVTDRKTSDPLREDGVVQSKQGQSDGLGRNMSEQNLPHEVESVVHVKASANIVQIKADSAQDIDVGGHGDMFEVSDTKGEGEEAVYVLSVASDLPVVDHPDILIEDFKDHRAVKFNIPLILGSAEVVRPLVDGNKDSSSADVNAVGDNFEQDGEREKIQANSCLEGLEPRSSESVASLDVFSEQNKTDFCDLIPIVTFADGEVDPATELSGGDNAPVCEVGKVEKFVANGNESREGLMEKQLLEISKTTFEPLDNLAGAKLDQTTSLPGGDDTDEQEKSLDELSDIAFSERTEVVAAEEKCAGNTNGKLESGHQYLESSYIDSVSDSTEVDVGTGNSKNKTQKHPNSQKSPNEDSQEAVKEPEIDNDIEVVAECVGAVSVDSEQIHGGDDEVSERISEKPILKEPGQLTNDFDYAIESSSTVEDCHGRDSGKSASGVVSEPMQEEGSGKLTKQHCGVDISVDSSSQNSLEGNWGSVSVLSTQSDAQVSIDTETLPLTDPQVPGKSKDNSEKLGIAPDGRHLDKLDVFEPPSFMTLVESGGGVDPKATSSEIVAVQKSQQAKSEDLPAGWFPSLTNVSNESEGRKKNEEVIAKVTNWSTGKHNSLKNLLGEGNAESKLKPPNPKQPPTVIQEDETSAKNNGILAATVKSDLSSEAPASQGVKREPGKEWNSPARFPTGSKKDGKKVKGKPSWVPFVCCSSVNVN